MHGFECQDKTQGTVCVRALTGVTWEQSPTPREAEKTHFTESNGQCQQPEGSSPQLPTAAGMGDWQLGAETSVQKLGALASSAGPAGARGVLPEPMCSCTHKAVPLLWCCSQFSILISQYTSSVSARISVGYGKNRAWGVRRKQGAQLESFMAKTCSTHCVRLSLFKFSPSKILGLCTVNPFSGQCLNWWSDWGLGSTVPCLWMTLVIWNDTFGYG